MNLPAGRVPLWPGTSGPTTIGPLRPSSIRRTTSVDMLRPEGPDGRLVLRGAGRDLEVNPAGATVVLAAATTEIDVEPGSGRRVSGIRLGPAVPGQEALLGASVIAGFARTVADALPSDALEGSLLGVLLLDVPVTTLISNAGVVVLDGRRGPRPWTPPAVDTCAGWVDGGILAADYAVEHRPAVRGVEAPLLAVPDGRFHHQSPLPFGSMRRARCLDLTPSPSRPGEVLIDSMFRDTVIEADASATIVHEYTMRLRVGIDLVITHVEVIGQVLPSSDCLGSRRAVEALAGTSLADLSHAASGLRGTVSCTHLNTALRVLAGLDALVLRVAHDGRTGTITTERTT